MSGGTSGTGLSLAIPSPDVDGLAGQGPWLGSLTMCAAGAASCSHPNWTQPLWSPPARLGAAS